MHKSAILNIVQDLKSEARETEKMTSILHYFIVNWKNYYKFQLNSQFKTIIVVT